MSSNPTSLDKTGVPLGKQSTGSWNAHSAWEVYRCRAFPNFNREVLDFPNATVSINLGPSAGWVDSLAGITNNFVGFTSGADYRAGTGVNQIVGTGIFSEVANTVSLGQGMYTGSTLLGWFPGEYSTEFSYLDPKVATLLGNVQQITMVEPVDQTKLAQRAVLQECSLSAQLRRIRKLQAGWDGDAAPVVTDETGGTAQEVIGRLQHAALSKLALSEVRLGPLPDGTLRFECRHSDKELFLTISGKDIEIQAWQPLNAVEAIFYGRTNAAGVGEHLEWLVK